MSKNGLRIVVGLAALILVAALGRSVRADVSLIDVPIPSLAPAEPNPAPEPNPVPELAPADLVGIRPIMADNLITGPTSRQAATQPVEHPDTGAQRTLAEFVGHFSPYQPMYIVAGPVDPLVKFQLSFKYRIFNPDSPIGKIPFIGNLDFAYTQQSLWRLDKPSAPFYDTNYMPEFFYNDDDVQWLKLPGVKQLGLMGGYSHDSNGQAGTTSRQINMLFVQPTLTFGDPEDFHFYVSPKAYVYIGDTSQNPDIANFRGYVDARFVIGWKHGLELSAIGRIGSHANRGSVLLDLTYPLRELLFKNVDVYVDAQYFNGYGESLLEYNTRQNEFRIGFSLVR